ncbi:NAD-dependent epimerase/dehydratase family protein [Terasakiella pusilla]|jgi:UDP-glucose 4-epimerase|uniref:NAD-dependent epimerase/dehydratase family protein n=1 Tax=Terasakiella pusilla TaxID=64973 RepID=UPI003AA8360B
MEKIIGKKVFITGGAGFIGSTLVGQLIEDNEVVVYDTMDRNAIASKPFSSHKNLTMIQGNVLDYGHLEASIQGCDTIIHAAGIAGIDTVIKSPTKTMEVNMVGSANVLKAANTLDKCERVVCFSTSEVFGSHAFSVHEGSQTVIGAVGEARWTYAVSKLAEEHLAQAYYSEFGLPTVVLRPFNVYGPSQIGEGALKIFIERALKNETIMIHGEGTQIRAWCFVDDMVEGTLRAISEEKAVGESFNIGNNRSVETIYGLANTVVRILGSTSEIEFSGVEMADIELRIPDTTKATELLGFTAKVGLEEGIARTAKFIKNNL